MHEYSHMFVNKDAANESEADSNAILLFLGLGFPRIECLDAFTNIFYNSPTDRNRIRLNKIEEMINSFEEKQFKIY